MHDCCSYLSFVVFSQEVLKTHVCLIVTITIHYYCIFVQASCSYSYYCNAGLLTKKFITLMKQAEDGVLDLNKAADTLNVGILPNADSLLLCFEKA